MHVTVMDGVQHYIIVQKLSDLLLSPLILPFPPLSSPTSRRCTAFILQIISLTRPADNCAIPLWCEGRGTHFYEMFHHWGW